MLAEPAAEAASLSRLQGGQASAQRRTRSLDTLKKVEQKTHLAQRFGTAPECQQEPDAHWASVVGARCASRGIREC